MKNCKHCIYYNEWSITKHCVNPNNPHKIEDCTNICYDYAERQVECDISKIDYIIQNLREIKSMVDILYIKSIEKEDNFKINEDQ